MPIQPTKDEIKAETFAEAYIKHGMNGTRAYQELSKQRSRRLTDKSASVQSSRMLRKDRVQKALHELLPDESIISKQIKKAITAETPKNIDWKAKHRFIETALKLKGYLSDKPSSNVNVALVIKRET